MNRNDVALAFKLICDIPVIESENVGSFQMLLLLQHSIGSYPEMLLNVQVSIIGKKAFVSQGYILTTLFKNN